MLRRKRQVVACSVEEMVRAREVLKNAPRALSRLALLGDKAFFFSPNDLAFILYGTRGKKRIALGDPVGPVSEAAIAVQLFWEACRREGKDMAFYNTDSRHLALYLEYGLSLYKIGEEARVPLREFSMSGGQNQKLRQLCHHYEKQNVVFRILPRAEVPAAMPELRQVSDVWLRSKRTREKRFSMGYFNESYLRECDVAVIRKEGRIIAFTNLLEGAGKREIAGDLVRYLPQDSHGAMEYLFLQIILWAKKEGYEWFNLGMAPLSGLRGGGFSPRWNRLGTFLFLHGEHFYHFKGLRLYKEKVRPVWEPRYLACKGGAQLPRVLAAIALLISGGFKGMLAK